MPRIANAWQYYDYVALLSTCLLPPHHCWQDSMDVEDFLRVKNTSSEISRQNITVAGSGTTSRYSHTPVTRLGMSSEFCAAENNDRPAPLGPAPKLPYIRHSQNGSSSFSNPRVNDVSDGECIYVLPRRLISTTVFARFTLMSRVFVSIPAECARPMRSSLFPITNPSNNSPTPSWLATL